MDGDPSPLPVATLDFTVPPNGWSRQQRVHLAQQLHAVLSTSDVARRLGVAPSTVRDYLSDPDGQQARTRRSRQPKGKCRSCGHETGARRGRREFSLCARCSSVRRTRWTREAVIHLYLDWRARFGAEPTSTDWNHTHSLRRGGTAIERFNSGNWPTTTVVVRLFGRWSELANATRTRDSLPLHATETPPREARAVMPRRD